MTATNMCSNFVGFRYSPPPPPPHTHNKQQAGKIIICTEERGEKL